MNRRSSRSQFFPTSSSPSHEDHSFLHMSIHLDIFPVLCFSVQQVAGCKPLSKSFHPGFFSGRTSRTRRHTTCRQILLNQIQHRALLNDAKNSARRSGMHQRHLVHCPVRVEPSGDAGFFPLGGVHQPPHPLSSFFHTPLGSNK